MLDMGQADRTLRAQPRSDKPILKDVVERVNGETVVLHRNLPFRKAMHIVCSEENWEKDVFICSGGMY